MRDNNFAEKLIEKIKTEKIEPRPRWHFLLKNYFIWLFGVLSLIFGALGTSVIIYLFKYNNFDLVVKSDKVLSFLIISIPYFWFFFLLIFIFIIYYNFKHTKKGYRYKPVFIILAAIIFSILLGEIFFLAGLGKKIDDILGAKARFYKEMFNPQLDFWFSPEEGRLAGIIIFDNNKPGLLDPSGNYWELISNDIFLEQFFSSGQPVNIIGQISKDKDDVFEVRQIKNARSGQEFMRRFRDFRKNGQCFKGDCPLPPDFERFKDSWPEHFFERFPERPGPMIMKDFRKD